MASVRWVGTTFDDIVGPGNIRATISQTASSLSGTWASTFSDPSDDNGGTLGGNMNGASVSATLTPRYGPGCQYAVTATLNSGATQMTGSYVSVSCNIAVTGSITLTKASNATA